MRRVLRVGECVGVGGADWVGMRRILGGNMENVSESQLMSANVV